jgi:type IV fimbrial biogenesis protein FimT
MNRDRSGFTLLELLAACIVLIILGAITVAGFRAALPGYRLKAAARELYSNMHRSKMIAIKNNTDCTISYSTGPDQYHLSGITRTVTLGDYGGGIRFLGPQGQTFAAAVITFNPRGTCNSGYAYLTDEHGTAYYRVGPLSTGIIKLQVHVGNGVWR